MKKVSIVIPVFNEEDNIPTVIAAIEDIFQSIAHYDFEIIFVNDGSRDRTLSVLERASAENAKIKYISLSRNFGHQAALKAGYDHAFGNAVISMDGDMQHPPSVIPELLQCWEEGFDIVSTIRDYGDAVGGQKKVTSYFFYKILNSISDVKLAEGGGSDFRLLSQPVVAEIRKMQEADLFLRGVVQWVGFRQTFVTFRADRRLSGESKYTFSRMLRFALSGLTSFSTKPLYLSAYLGLFFSVFAVVFYLIYVLISFLNASEISGWASLILTIVFFGGLQLSILGIIGIYLGKVFMQMKNRPAYIIHTKNF